MTSSARRFGGGKAHAFPFLFFRGTAAVAIALAALIGGGQAGCKPAGSRPVASVDGEPIRRDAFEAELRRVRGETGDLVLQGEVLSALRMSVLNQLIENRLVTREAARYGIGVSEAEVDQRLLAIRADYAEGGFDQALRENFVNVSDLRDRLRQSVLQEKTVHEAVGKGLEPDDEELLRYYQRRAADFSLPERVQVRQIVVRNREEGEALRARILQGESFVELAKQHSLTPDAREGGDVGVFARGEMPPEFDLAFTLPKGKVSTVIRSQYGYHILMVVDQLPARIRPFEEVRDELRTLLIRDRMESAYQHWIQQLRDEADIRIFQDVIEDVE